MTSMSGHQRPHRGLSDVWLTPPEILDALREAGGPFDLDPCAAVGQPWRTAEVQYTEPDDGLAQEWCGYVWLNPPFGDQAGRWLDRLAAHGNGIALCAARTETGWFRRAVWTQAWSVLFLARRPHFHLPTGERAPHNSGVPICLVSYGFRAAQALEGAELDGSLVRSWTVQGKPPP